MKFINQRNFGIVGKKFLIFLIASFTFFGGYFLGRKDFKVSFRDSDGFKLSREVPSDRSVEFSLFWKVWDILDKKYFDKTKLVPSKMVYGAIKGMVSAIDDPYTIFLPPSENKLVQEDLSGNFDGVGIQIGFIGTQLAVIAPLPGSPAEKAGVKAGDFIIGIKDEIKNIDTGTVGISLPDAVQIIRGEKGTKVILKLLREGIKEPFDVEIIRENISVPSMIIEYPTYTGLKEKSVAHLKLIKFSKETTSEWEEKVIELLKNDSLEGIILDLRNNPGGYLDVAVNIASDFLDNGKLVVVEEVGDGTREEYRVQKLPRLKNYKLVVLINRGSASASEILAGALRDGKRAKLVGESSFGKGTIQEPQQVDGGAGLHITIAKWLTPSGIWVNEKGLEPDIEVEDNPDTLDDEQLQKAFELFKL